MAEDNFNAGSRSNRYSTRKALGFQGGDVNAAGNLQRPSYRAVEGTQEQPRAAPAPQQNPLDNVRAEAPRPEVPRPQVPSTAQAAGQVAVGALATEGAKRGVQAGVKYAGGVLDNLKTPDFTTGANVGKAIPMSQMKGVDLAQETAPGVDFTADNVGKAIPASSLDGVDLASETAPALDAVPTDGITDGGSTVAGWADAPGAEGADAFAGGGEGVDALSGGGDAAGSTVPWIGGAIRLSQGDPRGAAGSVIGGTLGSYFGPVGTAVGSYLGGKVAAPIANEFWRFNENVGGENFARVADPFASLTETADIGQNIENTVKAPFGFAHDVNDSVGNVVSEAGQDVGNSIGGDVGNFVGDTISSIGDAVGGCFITEAVMAAGGAGDNAEPLLVLRAFRDQVMMATPEGQAMVQQYYEMAPLVVAAVSQRPDALQIFAQIYHQYIGPAVEAVKAGDMQQALAIYASMLSDVSELAAEGASIETSNMDSPDDMAGMEQLGVDGASVANSPAMQQKAVGMMPVAGAMPQAPGMPTRGAPPPQMGRPGMQPQPQQGQPGMMAGGDMPQGPMNPSGVEGDDSEQADDYPTPIRYARR